MSKFIHSRPKNLALEGKDNQMPLSINHNRPRPLGRGSRRLFCLIGCVAFFIFVFSSLSFSQQAEQLTITTYYPSPAGNYRELQLYPSSSATSGCGSATDEGKMYYDSVAHQLKVCQASGSPLSYGWTGGGSWTQSGDNLYATNTNSKVGIGTTSPSAKLQINDNYNGGSTGLVHLQSSGSESAITMQNSTQKYKIGVLPSANGSFSIIDQTAGGIERMNINKYGATIKRAPLALASTEATLYVDGTLTVRQLIQAQGNLLILGNLEVLGDLYVKWTKMNVPDYLFEPDYKLESIEEHSAYMWKYKHLKAIPKMKKDKNGKDTIELGAMNKGILEELEKAHIYIEQLNKQVKELKTDIQALKTK